MKEELTTKMHFDFFEGEELLEMKALAVYANLEKGKELNNLLKEYELTLEEYNKYKP